MDNIAELDSKRNAGDHIDNVGEGSRLGEATAESLQNTLKTLGENITLGSLLCLGAGQAFPEIEFASTMGIPPQDIVLVDKLFSTIARQRLASVAPAATLEQTGLFDYLTRAPDGRRFSLITTFGLYDALRDPVALDTFFRLAPNVLDSSGIVVISHGSLSPEVVRETALQHNFRPISRDFFRAPQSTTPQNT